ncbi:TorF family putative porin [Pseudoduganella chitinolytica]|uniref:TorF family putative porin n=1 Tax=Pseudoduganella chitinolytica TaxID=34070 RepID=A0ABY8B8C4_9BURK|nr:TorF family putative porin [Pseudoduganella chitinolytica]WEF31251.1 TorF family putative porin [Pseudoduganella chitinolytica]
MKRLISGVVTSLLCTTCYAHDGAVSFNAAATSDYRYRGISQTRLRPALQGGVDWADSASGVYAGAWASTIRWTRDAGGGGGAELDLYAGRRGALASGVTYDAGVLGYAYPSNGLQPSADTLELYGQLGYGPATVKYSHALTNLFGFAESRHSDYLDAAVNRELGAGWTLNLHAGRQRVRGHAAASYTDWKAGVTKDLGLVTVALSYVGTNAGKAAYASPANGKFTGRDALVLTVARTF